MRDLIHWYKRNMECIDCGVDIPLLDWVVCMATVPFYPIVIIALLATAPIWGIPYAIYRSRKESKEKEGLK